jgi:hypothetical protein
LVPVMARVATYPLIRPRGFCPSLTFGTWRVALLDAAAVATARWLRRDTPDAAARRAGLDDADVARRDSGAVTTTGGSSPLDAPLAFC